MSSCFSTDKLSLIMRDACLCFPSSSVFQRYKFTLEHFWDYKGVYKTNFAFNVGSKKLFIFELHHQQLRECSIQYVRTAEQFKCNIHTARRVYSELRLSCVLKSITLKPNLNLRSVLSSEMEMQDNARLRTDLTVTGNKLNGDSFTFN